jgi:hypothetical protein
MQCFDVIRGDARDLARTPVWLQPLLNDRLVVAPGALRLRRQRFISPGRTRGRRFPSVTVSRRDGGSSRLQPWKVPVRQTRWRSKPDSNSRSRRRDRSRSASVQLDLLCSASHSIEPGWAVGVASLRLTLGQQLLGLPVVELARSLDRQAVLALAAARIRSMSARARARRSARTASLAAFRAASARRARKSEVR